MTRTQPLLLTLTLLCAAPAAAQELVLIGRHPLTGARAGVAFTGELEIRNDASFRAERAFADGRREVEEGVARLEERALVLARSPGLVGALALEDGEARAFTRADGDDRIRMRWTAGEDYEQLDLGEAETTWEMVLRLLKNGREWRWLLARNRGMVEPSEDGLWIMRSRQPQPGDLLRFAAKGGRTVLSLNGDQDKEATLFVEDEHEPGRRRAVQVNLQAFIAEQGLQHHWVKMSAKRVPTDAELIEVFRVLLDDTKRPILFHCTGGADRTGVIAALYEIEFLGASKEEAKRHMRAHMWAAHDGTEIQGAYVDLYQPGRLRELLRGAGVEIPARYRK